ncbi:MAG: protein kinase family protein [Proteobacteria bacterium]|nr:protein kinase family protein [Pseudomonadota bacterium]
MPSTTDIKKNQLEFEGDEWAPANNHFKTNPNVNRFKKKNKDKGHSFVKIQNKLIALANKKVEGILGQGSFGVVKLGQDKDGNKYAVKVEGKKDIDEQSHEYRAMKLLNFYHGTMKRNLGAPKKYLKETTDVKTYTLLELQEGVEFSKVLVGLNNTQKLICAIACCQAIKQLHLKRIIHCDIKPENFVAKVENNDITIKAVDFGFSLILPNNQNYIIDGWAGTPGYIAPEIDSENKFSFSSDIYALGIMFKKDLGLPAYLYSNLIHQNPSARCCSLDDVIHALTIELNKPESSKIAASTTKTAASITTQATSTAKKAPSITASFKQAANTPIQADGNTQAAGAKWNLNDVLKYATPFFYKPFLGIR